MVKNLEDATVVLLEADAIRELDPDADTEDSVIDALLNAGVSPGDTLVLKPRYIRALRIMVKSRVDQQG